MDEFETIARLFRPLAAGAPEALNLMDDAAVLPARPGFDFVVTKDAMVEGVHFLPDDPPDLVARKLLRVNLSDLAAKGAEPYGYLLATAWPAKCDESWRSTFARGLAQDQARFGLKLFGGDTVSTPGPLTLSATLFGHVPAGTMMTRGGARAGDTLLVSGTIGDGFLGLKAACGDDLGLRPDETAWLAKRYRLPEPRLNLRGALRAHASAAADVSDGLMADAGHIGEASGMGIEIDLADLPLSPPASRWLSLQPDRDAALIALATGGDDYEIVCAVAPPNVQLLKEIAEVAGTPLASIGALIPERITRVTVGGRPVSAPASGGWRHS